MQYACRTAHLVRGYGTTNASKAELLRLLRQQSLVSYQQLRDVRRRPRSSSPLLVARRILDLTNQIRSMLHLNGRQGPKPVSRMDGGSSW